MHTTKNPIYQRQILFLDLHHHPALKSRSSPHRATVPPFPGWRPSPIRETPRARVRTPRPADAADKNRDADTGRPAYTERDKLGVLFHSHTRVVLLFYLYIYIHTVDYIHIIYTVEQCTRAV